MGSPPRRIRTLRHRRAPGCWAPAARCTAAAPSGSTRLGSAPRRSSSATTLRSGVRNRPQFSPPYLAPPRTKPCPHRGSSSCSAARSLHSKPVAAPILPGPLSPRFRLPVSNFPRHPCAHALPRLLARVSASACAAGYSARGSPRRTRVYFGVGEFQCLPSWARSLSGSRAGPGAADKGPRGRGRGR